MLSTYVIYSVERKVAPHALCVRFITEISSGRFFELVNINLLFSRLTFELKDYIQCLPYGCPHCSDPWLFPVITCFELRLPSPPIFNAVHTLMREDHMVVAKETLRERILKNKDPTRQQIWNTQGHPRRPSVKKRVEGQPKQGSRATIRKRTSLAVAATRLRLSKKASVAADPRFWARMTQKTARR